MPFYIGDYLRDTSRLTTEGHGAYLLMIFDYWVSGKPLPDDDHQLAAVARLAVPRWKALRPTLAQFFQVGDGVWRHKRIDAELETASGNLEKRHAAGKEGAAARWGNRNGGGNGNRMPLASEPHSDRNASANAPLLPSPLASNASKQLETDSLPREWAERAEAARADAGLPEVDLQPHWAKFISKVGDDRTVERWLGWALMARPPKAEKHPNGAGELPDAPWPQRCRAWAKGSRWHVDWGPAPSEAGCWAPPELVADALSRRRADPRVQAPLLEMDAAP
jgi:uncharacterized protein YdaU (DUF1376 family)